MPNAEIREALRLIGSAPSFSAMLEQVSQLAALDKPVLIVGERGTGKELVASRVHYLSMRWEQQYNTLNCGALSDSLIESELFGHEAGAFTGAVKRHQGLFERSDGGTLFMDELATTSARVQEQLLRVIEYGEFQRIGGRETLHSDLRLIAATNEDLPTLAEQGKFRYDLLDRLSFDVVTLPPLRARQEDIPELAEHFANGMSRELGREFFAGFAPEAIDNMLNHYWPGNVRQLKNTVERSVYRHTDVDTPVSEIVFDPFESPYRPSATPASTETQTTGDTAEHMPIATEHSPRSKPCEAITLSANFNLRDHLEQRERDHIASALAQEKFNQRRAADLLGLSYHQLRASLRKFPDLV